MGWHVVSLAATPILEVLFVFFCLALSSSWLLLLGLCQLVAVAEPALHKVEEVTNELALVLFTDAFEKLRVHLLLQIIVHVDLHVSFEEGLLPNGDLVHVSGHTHFFNLRQHFGLGHCFETHGFRS